MVQSHLMCVGRVLKSARRVTIAFKDLRWPTHFSVEGTLYLTLCSVRTAELDSKMNKRQVSSLRPAPSHPPVT